MLRKQNADAKLEKADIAEHDDQVKLNAPKHAFHKCSAEEKSECHARLEEANATFQKAQGSTQRAKEGRQDARKRFTDRLTQSQMSRSNSSLARYITFACL